MENAKQPVRIFEPERQAACRRCVTPASRHMLSTLVCIAMALAHVAAAQTPVNEIDAGAWLAEAQTRLGVGAGTITLDRPAVLNGVVTLAANHSLVIAAPLRLAKGATVRLAGHNDIRCTAPLTTEAPTAIFAADNATALSISGCNASAKIPAGYLLTVARGAGVTLAGNTVTGMGLFTTTNSGGPKSETSDVTITGNSSFFPAGQGDTAVYLLYVQHAVVNNNRFQGNVHGVEWWGGDANGGWGGIASVKNTGDMSISGNVCVNIHAACIWGSMGRNISVTGNSADGCGDVCFDVEGGIDTVFAGNSARGCGFGCYAVEFESAGVSFAGNLGTSDDGHAMVLVKHGSGNPNWHTDLSITGNTFRCSVKCPALYTEGEDGLIFANNVITNGFIENVNYHNDVRITGNTFRITADFGNTAVINAPALFHHHTSEVSDNFILNEGRSQQPVTCISQGYSDFNDTDDMYILRNTCTGFNAGIVTVSSGPNPGAPTAVWLISGNHITATKPYLHTHVSGSEAYTFRPDNTEQQGSAQVLSK